MKKSQNVKRSKSRSSSRGRRNSSKSKKIVKTPVSSPPKDDADAYLAIEKFSLDTYKEIAKSSATNLLYSPISLALVLGMVMFGARRNTLKQLASILVQPQFIDLLGEQVKMGFNGIGPEFLKTAQAIKSGGGDTVKLSSMMYVDKTFPLKEEFNRAIKAHFEGTSAKKLNFQTSEAKNEINKDIAQATDGKIDPMFEDPLDPDTVCILVNAIFFKGLWVRQFDRKKTKEAQFYGEDGDVHKVDMMHQKFLKGEGDESVMKWGESDQLKSQAIKLSYRQSRISLIIILPNKGVKLKSLESQLTVDRVADLWLKLHVPDKELILDLPRFRIESGLDLIPMLKNLGVEDMFDVATANFLGMSPHPKVYVTDVKQKAIIEVNEEGTQAVAATAVVLVKRCARSPPRIKFRCDRPFMYLLVCERENSQLFPHILFIGAYKRPP